MHNALLEGNLVISEYIEHICEVSDVLGLICIREPGKRLGWIEHWLSWREHQLSSTRRSGWVVVLDCVRSSAMTNLHGQLGKVAKRDRHQALEVTLTVTEVLLKTDNDDTLTVDSRQ